MQDDIKKSEKKLLNNVLESGVWGTIGPKSIEAGNIISEYCNKKYGLCVYSYSVALETLLRAFEIGYGDEVITASYGNPINSMTVAAIGAQPIFADIDYITGTISKDKIENLISTQTKAIIVDTIAGNTCDIEAFSKICRKHNIYLIENAVDSFKTSSFSDAIIFDLGTSNGLDLGLGGVILTDNEDIFQSSFAYHNCGRHLGEYNNLKVDFILGGNMRIPEWQSTLVESRINVLEKKMESNKARILKIIKDLECEFLIPLKQNGLSDYNDTVVFIYEKIKNNDINKDDLIIDLKANGFNIKKGFSAMHRQEAFTTEYFKRITGCLKEYSDKNLENSVKAEDNYIWISI